MFHVNNSSMGWQVATAYLTLPICGIILNQVAKTSGSDLQMK
jgi:hypothetical protein